MERDRIKSASGKEPELYESPGLAPVRKYGKGVALTYHGRYSSRMRQVRIPPLIIIRQRINLVVDLARCYSGSPGLLPKLIV
jgi:hypothetical protein